jgi:hypothetical protein
MNSGLKLNHYCQSSKSQNAAADRGLTTAESLKAYSGCYAPVRRGRMFPKNMQAVRPAGDDYGTGKNKISGLMPGEHFLPNSMSEASLTGANALSTAVSHLPKKGRMRRKDQKRQGNEVDGGGRRPRYSFGKPLGLCVPGGSQTRRKDARKNSCASMWTWASQTQTQTSHCRSWLRFGPIAKTSCSAKYRAYLPASCKSQKETNAGWPQTPPLQATIQSRTHVRMAGQLSQTHSAIRPKHNYLSCVLSYSLFNHNSQEVMKWLLILLC